MSRSCCNPCGKMYLRFLELALSLVEPAWLVCVSLDIVLLCLYLLLLACSILLFLRFHVVFLPRLIYVANSNINLLAVSYICLKSEVPAMMFGLCRVHL